MILIFQAACILDNVAIFSLGVYRHSNDNLIGKLYKIFFFGIQVPLLNQNLKMMSKTKHSKHDNCG